MVVVGTGDGQSEKRVIVSMARHFSWRQVLQTVAVDVTDLQCASVCTRETLCLCLMMFPRLYLSCEGTYPARRSTTAVKKRIFDALKMM